MEKTIRTTTLRRSTSSARPRDYFADKLRILLDYRRSGRRWTDRTCALFCALVLAGPAWAGDVGAEITAAALTAALLVFALFAVAYLMTLAAGRRVRLDVRLLLLLWIAIGTVVYCSFPAAAAGRAYPIERYVAWIEAHSELRRPAEPLPEIRHVSLGEIIAVVRYARLGAYEDGVVYLRETLPLHQRRVVAFHEIVHWMQPWGCVGERELQAHRLTEQWARETGERLPPIRWGQVYAMAEECRNG